MRRARSRPRRGHRRQRPARLQRCLARAVRRGGARCGLCRRQDRRQRHLRERGRRRDRLLAERAVLRRAPEPDRRQPRRDLLRRRHQDRVAREPGRAERHRAQRQVRRSQRLCPGRQPRRFGEPGQGQLHLGLGTRRRLPASGSRCPGTGRSTRAWSRGRAAAIGCPPRARANSRPAPTARRASTTSCSASAGTSRSATCAFRPTMLYAPASHEPLTERPWDEDSARAAIAEIVAETEGAFDEAELWPAHPRDLEDGPLPARVVPLPRRLGRDLGAARARARGPRRPRPRLGARRRRAGRALPGPARLPGSSARAPVPSLLMGEAGILLVAHTLAPAPLAGGVAARGGAGERRESRSGSSCGDRRER